jgi:hypothetical protein
MHQAHTAGDILANTPGTGKLHVSRYALSLGMVYFIPLIEAMMIKPAPASVEAAVPFYRDDTVYAHMIHLTLMLTVAAWRKPRFYVH